MRVPGKDAIYEVAAKFRDGCLRDGLSLLWPSHRIWTKQNADALVDLYINAPDEGSRSFYDKFRDQLANAPVEVHRLAADILTLYLLFPSRISPETKLGRLELVISWKIDEVPETFDLVRRAFDSAGIGFPGAHYQTGQHWQMSFFMLFAQRMVAANAGAQEPDVTWRVAHEVEATLPHKSGSGPHVLLHLFFPDKFERIASTPHKRLISGLFERTPSANIDDDVAKVREIMAARIGRSDFDFYDPDVELQWRPPPVVTQPAVDSGEKRVWIEKTLVEGRPDRITGPYALGKALWSPQRDRGGGNTYRFMRDVRAGDVVLHLTDNEAISGVSEAAGQAEEFGGVPGTAWEGSCYLVRLEKFRRLNPPLSREVFFGSPYRERLIALINQGERNLFFHRGAALNQGKYITPASERLVDILDEAYTSVAGNSMFESTSPGTVPTPPGLATQGTAVTLVDVHASFSQALREARLVFGSDHESITRSFLVGLATKKFAILTGLSGSGKTQIALRFGDWLGENQRLLVPVRPDWTGSEALFGYEDVLQEPKGGRRAWHVSETLAFMLSAARDPSAPYLLILDEMNLAHVERYFADVLSGMESSQTCLPNLSQVDGVWRRRDEGGAKLSLPRNLLIAGTVNVDETTYLFSPKVLDRANTFEFRVRTEDLADDAVRPGSVQAGEPELVSHFLEVCSDEAWHVRNPAAYQPEFVAELRRLHQLLSAGGFEFGHRVFYEAVRFAALLSAAGEEDMLIALDHQVLQKVLPRMHGSRRRLEAPLCALANYCFDLTLTPESAQPGATPAFAPTAHLSNAAKLPRSFDKTRRMATALRANQFTSFTE